MEKDILIETMQNHTKGELREMIKKEILNLSKQYGNIIVRNEIHKFFSKPPFILTKEDKVIFL